MRMSTRICGTLVLPSLLAFAPVAHAAPVSEWRPTVSLNQQDMATAAQFTFAGDGLPTAIWSLSPGGANPSLREAQPQTDGSWKIAEITSGKSVTWPSIASDPDGRVYAVWGRESSSGNWLVEFGTRGLDGRWEIATLATASRVMAIELTRTDSGVLSAAWSRQVGSTQWQIQVAKRVPGGSWQIDTVAEPVNPGYVALHTAADGTSTVGWLGSMTEAMDYDVYVSEPSGPTGWQTTRVAGPYASSLMATGAADRAGFVWARSIGGTMHVESRIRLADGVWSQTDHGTGSDTAIAAAADGRVTALWSDGAQVHSADRRVGGPWSPAAPATPVSSYGSPRVQVGADGTTMGAWMRYGSGGSVAEFGERQANGSWTTEPLTDPGTAGGVRLGLSPDGSVVASWSEFRAAPVANFSRFRARDRSGPAHRDLEVPASSQPGDAVTFSVHAIDAWTAVEETTWDFGDGTGATGATASHRYAAEGRYTVTVTSRDSLGHAASTTRTITVGTPADEHPPAPPTETPNPRPESGPEPGPCPLRGITLTGLAASGTAKAPQVRLTGIADRSLAGERVTVRRDGTAVTTTVVRADGAINATVAAPRDRRVQGRARYRLVAGPHRSLALQASRALELTRQTAQANGAARVAGRLVRGGRESLTVEVSTTYRGAAPKLVRKLRSDRSGRFTLTVSPSSTAGQTLIYRVRQGNRFVSLPIVVAAKR